MLLKKKKLHKKLQKKTTFYGQTDGQTDGQPKTKYFKITQTGVQLNSFGNKPKTKQTNDPANEKKSSNKSDEPNGKANSKPRRMLQLLKKKVDKIVDIKKWPTISD
jgi:hypothetical protein